MNRRRLPASWRWRFFAAAIFFTSLCAARPGVAEEFDISGEIGVEGRPFLFDTLHAGQDRHSASVFGEIEFVHEWDSGDRVIVKPFLRYDSADRRRTHFDLREALALLLFEDLDVRIGLGKVFWGVTESVHLIDIVNQTDLIENPDGEDKLGQPMAYLSYAREWGTIDLLFLPYFRERTFPGRGGRLRGPLIVETDSPRFESRHRRYHPDFAARYSHTIDELDFGVSYFRGTSRQPSFLLGLDDSGAPALFPFYARIDQVSLDAQYTTGAWLLKLEALYRGGQPDRSGQVDGYFAHVAGFEYTLFQILGTNMDLGILSEHLFDDRRDSANTPFENDLFVGARLAANDVDDTQILAGVIQDIGGSARNYFVEASRRVGDGWTVSVEARLITGPGAADLQFGTRDDDFLQLELKYSF